MAVPYSQYDDPQSLNLYGYVRNNPITGIDADGHCPLCPALAGAGGLITEEYEVGAAFGPLGLTVATGAAIITVGVIYYQNTRVSPAPAAPTTTTQSRPKPQTPSQPKQKPKSNPLKGKPGETSTTTKPDGTPKQTREYGDDGYPKTDTDFDHDHGQGQPHTHEWGRPDDGGPPTNLDRGPGQPVNPDTPPPQSPATPPEQPSNPTPKPPKQPDNPGLL